MGHYFQRWRLLHTEFVRAKVNQTELSSYFPDTGTGSGGFCNLWSLMCRLGGPEIDGGNRRRQVRKMSGMYSTVVQ